MIVYMVHDPNTFTGAQVGILLALILGAATVLTARSWIRTVLSTEATLRSSRVENPGEGGADAAVRIQHRDDGKPTGSEPTGGVAV